MTINVTTTTNQIVVTQSQINLTSTPVVTSVGTDRVRFLSDLDDVDITGNLDGSALIFSSSTGKFESSDSNDSILFTPDGGDF